MAKKKNFWVLIILLFVFLTFCHAQSERWVYRYNGPGYGWDRAFSIVYGGDGNVYAAGASTGFSGYDDFCIISLTTNGNERWVYRYNGPGNNHDWANSLVFGEDENIYVCGRTWSESTSADFVVISLTRSGSPRWFYSYNSPGNSWDEPFSIIYGADGNIYAAGVSEGDIIVISLTPDGEECWNYRYGDFICFSEAANSIVFGTDENIYLAGYAESLSTNEDFTIISLDTDGNERWVYRYNGPGNGYDKAYSLVYGGDGNIYVAGHSEDFFTLTYNFTVISLTSDGNERWMYVYKGAGNGFAKSIVYGNDSNIYVSGYSFGDSTDYDFVVISLNQTGILRWIYRYNGPGNNFDEAYCLNYGEDGNIYVGGLSYGNGTYGDFTVLSLNPDGQARWVYRYNGPGNWYDGASSVVYGFDGYLYSSGSSSGIGTDQDFTVISLNPAIGIEEQTASRNQFFNIRGLGRKIEFFLSLPEPATVPVSIYNLSGERVCSFSISVSKGTSHYQKDLSFLPTGIYFIKADFENKIITKKFMLLK